MSGSHQGFKAFLFHPELGNEVVEGSLFIHRFGIRFESATGVEEIPLARIEVECGDGEKIRFKDKDRPGFSIYTMEPGVFDVPSFPQLEDAASRINDEQGRRELSRRWRITLYVVAVCVILACGGSVLMGLVVRSLVARVPAEWERDFGRAEVEALSQGSSSAYSNEVRQLAVLVEPLIKVVPLGGAKVEFYIVDDPDPNAFALPGGFVVVTTGMLELVERPEELLGVLAHELAHVEQKHMARKIISSAGPVLLFGVFLHSRDSLLNLLGQGSGMMVIQGFSKEFETEADDVGWQYLVKANINPRGMIGVFNKLKLYEDSMKEGRAVPQAFQSHPLLKKRIARLEGKWKKLPKHEGFLEIKEAVPLHVKETAKVPAP